MTIPRTTAEWERVRRAKQDVLSRNPFSVDPADYPGVRPEVVASWRRSMLAGVDPEAREYVSDADFRPRTRLAAVAQPIMNRLKDEISGLNSWGFLADRACRLITVVVGDFPQAGRVHRQNLVPGMCFGEDLMGTNGLGCAHETRQAFLISGTEHFRGDAEILTTTGVIIRDPCTKRYAGTLGVHCLREYGSAAVLPLVIEIGRSIEAQLLGSRAYGERELFDEFSAAQRRYRGPVVGVSRQLCVVSTRARALVHEADEELLRRLAEETGSRRRSVRRNLSSGATVTIEILPVRQPQGDFAAVLVLHSVEPRRLAVPGPIPVDPVGEFRRRLTRAVGEHPVLVSGERGTGKRFEARVALRSPVELDGRVAQLRPRAWLHNLESALRNGKPVLLAHVTELPPELSAIVTALIANASGPVVGTTIEDSGLVREGFPVLLTMPPLRERRTEFEALCARLLGDQPITSRAIAALAARDWPGNLRQLRQVLASAGIHATGPVDLRDLPARHRPLDEVRAAERRVLMAALRDTGGDRNAVADRLGISRATVYRKLKRYELH
ncbi:helix-turn-helix domain-containing protein [Amycolatopsis sp. GM8]|uniref:sigma-54-dependent Fis family transcriptional regulator n=1 Tax=Amycolatopsis sp. GM8 TaxID=2896530 RepID=UPI001F02F781|nr:helix-turn-helix domain-containing protein [Amycolatopsis sp. GM8]